MTPIYHLTTPTAWRTAQESGVYRPPSLAHEGFIHASTSSQIAGSANRFFGGIAHLLVLKIDPARLDVPLVWEASPHSPDPFPHLYGPLGLNAVVAVCPWPRRADGRFAREDLALEIES